MTFWKADLELLGLDIEKHKSELRNVISSYIESEDAMEIDPNDFFADD